MLDVLPDLIGADADGDDRGDDRVGERELQGRRPRAACRAPCTPPEILVTRSISSGVASRSVILARPVSSMLRCDPGVEDAAHHDADPGPLTVRKLLLQNILLHQRVSRHRRKKSSGIMSRNRDIITRFVNSGPNPAHKAMRAQLIERPPAGGEELGEISRNKRFGQVEPEVKIVVNQQEVDAVQFEPHLRLFVRSA